MRHSTIGTVVTVPPLSSKVRSTQSHPRGSQLLFVRPASRAHLATRLQKPNCQLLVTATTGPMPAVVCERRVDMQAHEPGSGFPLGVAASAHGRPHGYMYSKLARSPLARTRRGTKIAGQLDRSAAFYLFFCFFLPRRSSQVSQASKHQNLSSAQPTAQALATTEDRLELTTAAQRLFHVQIPAYS